MKRLFLTLLGAAVLAVPAAQAQKVNREALNAAIEKSDAEIQDPKKAAKAATWIKRAQAYYAALEAPTKGVFTTMPSALLKSTCGNPKAQESVKLASGPAEAFDYNYITVYLQGDKVVAWTQKKQMVSSLYKNMMAALDRAYELDPKQAPKVKSELDKIVNFYKQEGNVNVDAGQYERAAQAYRNAYMAEQRAAYGAALEPVLLYNAGYLLTIDGAKNPKSYVLGEKCLRSALHDGYQDADGSSYYYLFHCYYGQTQQAEGEAREALLQKAKQALLDGVKKFPTNENIIGALQSLYMSEPTVGNPSELVDMIKAAVERDPKSVDMWSSLALLNYQLKDFAAAVAAGTKAVELAPDSFDTNYRLGVFYAAEGNAVIDKMRETNYTRQADYDADLAAANDAYRAATPWLEKAHGIQPENRTIVETLKSIFFRLRDEEGMMAKYEEYNALLQQM